MSATGSETQRQKEASGLPHGIAAYLLWGLLPIYFKLLPDVGAAEVVANRILWSLLLMAGILGATGALREFRRNVRNGPIMLAMAGSAALIGINWLVYIWAVGQGHILGASLGYFLNPLVNVALGVLVLKERLRGLQSVAILCAAAGVAMMAVSALETLWISLALAFSFALYALIRKVAPIGPRQGLAAETLILSPLAAVYLIWLAGTGALHFGSDARTSILLALSGIVTSVPLLLFATAARRMPLSALGLLQYLAPTLQFLVGLLLYGEHLGGGQLAAFAVIWTGLAIFTIDSIRTVRKQRLATA
ncbi:EamA family transporter RarD [Sphingobium aquiterrae]|uniref:EamA family transporter RarD n=1 Tax=Sphingobium aquiterrae TaxID=2038656 RepID=UPI003018CD74